MNSNGPPKDHVEERDDYGDETDDNLGSKATWQRLLFMFIMAVIFGLGVSVGFIVILLQFFWVLFKGEPKDELAAIGRQLGAYAREIVLYLTFNTDERPFPFDRDWPSG
jgi:hypothetical protein